MRQSHLVLSNAAIMWITRAFLIVPQVILVPYLIRTIGEGGYGLYALIWSLLMSVVQLEIALQQGVVKYSAGFLAQGRLDEVKKIVSSSFVYSLLLAVVTSGGLLAAAILFIAPSSPMRTALTVVALIVLFIVPLTPYVAVIQSRQRYYVGAVLDTVSKYGSLLAIVAWFQLVKPSLESVVVITAVFLFLSRTSQVPIAYRLVPGLQNRPRFFNWTSFRLIAAFGGATVLVNFSLAANSTGVRWLMGGMVSPSFVSHLAIILMPVSVLADIIRPMTITVMPLTSAYEAVGNQPMLKELLIRSMRYTTMFVLAGVIAAGLLTRNILTIWVGSRYAFLAPYAFALFACVSFQLSTSSAHHMLKGLGRLKTVVLIYLIALVLVPFAAILALFHLTRNPYLSVTIGLCGGSLLCGCLNIVYGLKAVQARWRGVWIRIFGQSSAMTAAVLLPAWGIIRLAGFDQFLGRAAVAVFSVLLYFAGCYVLIATKAERRQFLDYGRVVGEKAAQILRIKKRLKAENTTEIP